MGWTFPLLLLILILISFALGKSLRVLAGKRIFRIFFLPGLLAALVLRLLGCYITGAEVKKVTLFSSEGQALSYDIKEAMLLGRVIMGTLPFLAMLISLGVILLDHTYWAPEDSPALSSFPEKLAQLGQISVCSIKEVMWSVPLWVWKAVSEGDLSRLIGFYFIVALLVWLHPQGKELKYVVAGMAIVGAFACLPFYLIDKLKTGVGAAQEYKIALSLSRLVGVLIFALFTSVVCIRIPYHILKVARRRKQEVPIRFRRT